jgi:hypothetical protein
MQSILLTKWTSTKTDVLTSMVGDEQANVRILPSIWQNGEKEAR